jgi:L-serine dehydratase
VKAELFGSLGAPGKGHGSDVAVMLGLEGRAPEVGRSDAGPGCASRPSARPRRKLLGFAPVEKTLVALADGRASSSIGARAPAAPQRHALHGHDRSLGEPFVRVYYSVGGGFVVNDGEVDGHARARPPAGALPVHERSADLLAMAERTA